MGTTLDLPSSDSQMMMKFHCPNSASSLEDLRWQAWLYVLEDPALDRPAFELLLAQDDGTLGGAVAEAVEMSQALKSLPTAPSGRPVLVASACPVRPVVHCAGNDNADGPRGHHGWLGAALAVAAVLAASLLVAVQGVRYSTDRDSSGQPAPSSSFSLADSELRAALQTLDSSLEGSHPYLDSMIEVWTDFQSKHSQREVARAQNSLLADTESWLAVQDPMADHELPDWLVWAAAASPLETTESELN